MSQPLRILFLEDTQRDAELAVAALEAGGYACTWECVDTREAFLRHLRDGEYDIVISDYSLPAFDGLSAVRSFVELDTGIPFILISGALGDEAAIEALKAGANDFVLKDKFFRLPTVVERSLREKSTERQNRQAESQIRLQAAALDSTANAIVITAIDGTVTYVNGAFETLTGYSADEVMGQDLRILNSGQHNAEMFKTLWETILDGRVWQGELVNRHKSGTLYIEEQTITPVKDALGNIINFVAVKQDVSKRNRIEIENASLAAQVDAERERLNTIVASVPGVVWETWGTPDADRQNVDFVSRHVEKMVGYTVDEWLSKPNFWLTIVHPDDRERVRREAAAAFEARDTTLLEFRWITKDGRVIWVEVHSVIIADDAGLPIGVRGVTIDITERKKAENERRVISEIVEGVSTSANLDEFLQLAHRLIGQIVYAENCYVMLYDPADDMTHIEYWVDTRDPFPMTQPAGKGFSSYVFRTGQPLLLTQGLILKMVELGQVEPSDSASPSWLGVPLRTPAGTIGVLVLQHYEKECVYSPHDLAFLMLVADQIAIAIQRKRAEEALAESEERYRSVVETAPDVIITIDESSTIRFVNPAASRVFGYDIDEMKGASLTMLMPEYMRQLHNAGIKDYQATGNRRLTWDYVELKGLRRDGKEIPITLSFSEFTQNGRRFFTGIIRDISERKKAIELLRDSEERYRDLVENAIDIIYTHDLKGNYISVNKAAQKITGFTEEESLSMNLADTVAPEYIETARRMIEDKLAGHEVTAYDLEIIAKDGHRITLDVNTRIIYENGVPIGVQGIARDMTERRQLEEQFRQSQKMEAIGVLAGGIAHDFNNLLTAISGYSDLTLLGMNADDTLRHYVEEIKKAGVRAAALTSQLLAFGRKQVLKPRVHNLNVVINEIEGMLRRIIRENIEFRTVLDPGLWNIKADPGQMEQVIMNLAVNSRDAMPNGGTLTIETKNADLDAAYANEHITISPGRYVRVSVSDSGMGIEPATQRRIFEPFFTTKDIGKGTGLGLSTVHGIIKQSGGEILVYSEFGHGTTFKIYLPCVDEVVQKPKWFDSGKEDNSGTETILLVEDEEIVRHLVREVLTGNGYTVLEAKSGAEAISIAHTYAEPIHLLLTDVIMPRMGGRELKDQIVGSRPEIKVLFMSGYTDDSIVYSGFLGSETAFIEKPFSPDSLGRKLRQVLDGE